jgi:hypothetical protein
MLATLQLLPFKRYNSVVLENFIIYGWWFACRIKTIKRDMYLCYPWCGVWRRTFCSSTILNFTGNKSVLHISYLNFKAL